MTDAQKLTKQFREITGPGSFVNTWKWAKRVTAELEPLGQSKIGFTNSNATASILVFRCADRSKFAYDMNGAKHVWALRGEDV